MASDEPGYEIWSPKSGSRAHTRPRVEGKPSEKSGAWRAVFRRGFLQRVDRPRAPRNLRYLAGEELVGKSHWRQGDPTGATAVRKSDDGGFRKENKVTGRKHDHRNKKKRFSLLL